MNQPELNEENLFEAFEINVDPETGEIMGEPVVEGDILTVHLPRIARRLNIEKKQYENRITALQQEINRLQEIAQRYKQQYEKKESYLLDMVKGIMEENQKNKLEYPGIGIFRFRKLPDSVDSSEYDTWDNEKKLFYGEQFLDVNLFKKKIIITPNKKEIKKLLADKNSETLSGFKLITGKTKFEYKGEE